MELDSDLRDSMRQWELAVQSGIDDRFDWSGAKKALSVTKCSSKVLLEFGSSCFH